jgi:hypothetical protein
MSGAVRMQHAPRRRGASHSRRGGVRWRRPCTRPLRRSRHSIDSTLQRIEASARVIEAAGRFAPSRPIAATRKLLLVALWLAEAAAHLGRAARGFEETFDWIAAGTGSMADAQHLTEVTVRWTDASRRLVEVSNRFDAVFGQLHGAVISGVISPESHTPAFPVQAEASRTIVAHRGDDAPLFIFEPRAAGRVLAGARSISRGRAPPFLSVRTL